MLTNGWLSWGTTVHARFNVAPHTVTCTPLMNKAPDTHFEIWGTLRRVMVFLSSFRWIPDSLSRDSATLRRLEHGKSLHVIPKVLFWASEVHIRHYIF